MLRNRMSIPALTPLTPLKGRTRPACRSYKRHRIIDLTLGKKANKLKNQTNMETKNGP